MVISQPSSQAKRLRISRNSQKKSLPRYSLHVYLRSATPRSAQLKLLSSSGAYAPAGDRSRSGLHGYGTACVFLSHKAPLQRSCQQNRSRHWQNLLINPISSLVFVTRSSAIARLSRSGWSVRTLSRFPYPSPPSAIEIYHHRTSWGRTWIFSLVWHIKFGAWK